MNQNKRILRLGNMLRRIAKGRAVETFLREPATAEGEQESEQESMFRNRDEKLMIAKSIFKKIGKNWNLDKLNEREAGIVEAIVSEQERPVVFIRKGTYRRLPEPWTHFAGDAIRERLNTAIPSIGRIELPNRRLLPYGGTGFVVGQQLLMTNRHVAELFASGLGVKSLMFLPRQSAAINFKREKGDAEDDQELHVHVKEVLMIHPYWDMALLRTDDLPPGAAPLKLSVSPPEKFIDCDVAVIGYPARDDRNDLVLQDQIFKHTYHVKRLQPGTIIGREVISSFDNSVNAVTHDCSTLGGNSGSAVIDVETGEVVGLHFAGVYLEANYAVPTYELARDRRVVDAGVNFAGTAQPTMDWVSAWRLADKDEHSPAIQNTAASLQQPVAISQPSRLNINGLTATWTIPLEVSITLGEGTLATTAGMAATEGMRVPIIYDDIELRQGYQSNFLDLADGEIPLPELTEAGREVAATLDDGSTELKYHKFSIVMHKMRRLALFTASNVDWRKSSREIIGRKPPIPTRKELTGLGTDQEKWVTDARIPDAHQLPDIFYTKDGGAFDKGHLVRRDDVCWGSSFEDMQMANGDTFFTTNCSPQVAGFNRATMGEDNWGDLENLVQKQTKSEKTIIFSGPVLDDNDPLFVGRDERGTVRIQIPRKFWKIIVAQDENGPAAYGFVLEQDLTSVRTELVVPSQWKPYMCSIVNIEGLLNNLVEFGDLKRMDKFDTEKGCRIKESLCSIG